MVIDTSAALSFLFEESSAQWVLQQIDLRRGPLLMSTINLAETIILLRSRLLEGAELLESSLLSSGIDFVPPTVEQARIASDARLRFPLNLGDCFAYALSRVEKLPVLTLDEDFRRCDCPLLMPPRKKGRA
jgi:ribonuclease VapC